MKKSVSLLLAVALVFALGVTTVSAATPRWAHTSSIIPTMTASDGTYTCTVTTLRGTTNINIALVLYEKGFWGTYTQVSSKEESLASQAFTCVGKATIKSGTTYKLNYTITVTRNGTSEKIENSFEKKC